MNKNEIQLKQVENGWLVVSAPNEPVDERIPPQMRTPPSPVIHFCHDYDEVCTYIKAFFPIK
jgi:hypothetical protein